ncbi:MAG: N-acetylmuramoyl-L-alanine amidase [Planctomycetes bacterium]|nr:N-acetylmuramoyl-L-alanine amidase [Planctomycetota bacterium]
MLAAAALLLAMSACETPPMRDPPASQPAGDPMVSINTLVESSPDFARTRIGGADYPIPPWARHLKGVRIVLDPGHGGDAAKRGFKRGPSGVREAEMNLRIAQFLRDFLTAAGAEVRLTRESDVDLTHEARAAVANDWPADLFLSVHHNAVDNKPDVNYTSVWYHADIHYSPASLDLARYICDGLYDALKLQRVTEVPLKSDQLMYPDGFAVLRYAKVTAALSEASFYTHPPEEQRLRTPEYNLREAYGLFLAIAKYAHAGLPRMRLVEPADGVLPMGAGRRVVFELDDGLRSRKAWGWQRQMIADDSIHARLNGRDLPFTFNAADYRLSVEIPDDLPAGDTAIDVQFQNLYKNSVINPRVPIRVGAAPGAPQ